MVTLVHQVEYWPISRRRISSLLLLIFVFVISGCSGGKNSSGTVQPPSANITSVTVACSPTSIPVTQSATCASTVFGTGSFNSSVTWSVNPSSAGTITGSGIFTPSAVGIATITATSLQDSSKSGSSAITATNTTALAISITDLPQGTVGAVTITDPSGTTSQLTSTKIIAAVPGNYSIVAAPVTVSSGTYIAKLQTQSAQVLAGNVTSVTVDYYNVIPSTTKVLDSAGLQGLQISTDGSTLTISAASAVGQSLQPGNVLIIPPIAAGNLAPTGLIRKIVTVQAGSSVVVVKITPATLADAFQRLSFQINNSPTATTVQAVRPAPGVIFHPGARLNPRPQTLSVLSSSLQDPCGNFSLGVFDVTNSFSNNVVSGVTLAGQVEVCSGVNFSLDLIGTGFLGIQPQLNSLTATATVGEYSDLTLQGQYQLGLFSYGPFKLGTLQLGAIPVPGLPVWVSPEVSVFVGANGTLTTGFSTSIGEAGTITRGVTYSSGNWTPVQPTPSLQFSYDPPVLDASLDAKAYAGVQLDLMIWDLVGPSFKPDGYVAFNADITADPWWKLTGGVEGPMSVDVGFLGMNLASYSLGTMFDYSTVFAQASGPFASSASAPAVQSLSPSTVPVGSGAFTLNVSGSNFVPGAVVNFGTNALPSSWLSAGMITASVPATLVAASGNIPVTVTNPGIGAGTSGASNFTVTSTVLVTPAQVSVPRNSVQTFSAIVPGNGSVKWSVQEGSAGGTITSSGIYAAPSQTGVYHVVALNTANISDSAIATVNVVAGPTVTTLHSFDHAIEGAVPWSAPIFGSDGNLYGTTEAGGNLSCTYISSLTGCGTIYRLDASGNLTTLHLFSGTDGAYPVASLKETSPLTFYGVTLFGGSNTSQCLVAGTTTQSGCGSLFSFDSVNGFSSIYSFGPFYSSLGAGPSGALTLSNDKKTLYGANQVGGNSICSGTWNGKSQGGCGSVFAISSSNVVNALRTFSSSDGYYLTSSPIQQSDGYLYGVTAGGGNLSCSSYGTPGCGTVYQMTSSGSSVRTLHSFNSTDGADPYSPLIQASDGFFYGTTIFGGTTSCSGGAKWQGCGTIFKIDSAGNFTSLHSFSGPDGAYPRVMMQGIDGNFYGTTEGGGDSTCTGEYGLGCGTIFKMDPAGNVTVIYSFTGQSDGSQPESGVIQASDGSFYGTTAFGGVYDDGVIFQVINISTLSSAANQTAIQQGGIQAVTPLLSRRPHTGVPSLSDAPLQ